MKRIISFCLYGDDAKYYFGALENIKLRDRYFKGWICRFYIASYCESHPVILKLKKKHNVEVEVCSIPQNKEKQLMGARFYAIDDPDVEVNISRDTDSRLSKRDSWAVNKWLSMNTNVMTIRDHPAHIQKWPIMGGMCAFKSSDINYRDEYQKYTKNKGGHYGIDQLFLKDVIYPKCKNELTIFGDFEKDTIPIEIPRIDYEFIGDTYDENNIRKPEYKSILKRHIDNQ